MVAPAARGLLLLLVNTLEPGVDLAFGFVLGHAIALLESATEFCALALDHVEIVIGELTPLLLNFAFELFPIAFDTIPIHRFCSCCRSRWGKNPDVRTKVPTHNAAHVSESAAHRLG